VLPKVQNVRLERAGSQRWLVVQATPEALWPVVKEFWQESGFLIAEIVPFIQDKFAVMDQAAGRAIFGTSSGGFGALTLGMRYPNTFGHVVSHSGDMGFDTCYQADFLKLCVTLQRYPRGLGQFLEEFRRARDKSAYDHSALNAVAMAACYTPNPKSPWGFDLPVDTHTGEMIPSVWKRWQALDPVTACEKYSSGLSQLKTLRFDAGSRDEFYLHLGARRLARRLKALSIRHEYEEHGLGHFNLGERLDLTLALLTKRCKSRL
jgi:enterochelin esterase family protein